MIAHKKVKQTQKILNPVKTVSLALPKTRFVYSIMFGIKGVEHFGAILMSYKCPVQFSIKNVSMKVTEMFSKDSKKIAYHFTHTAYKYINQTKSNRCYFLEVNLIKIQRVRSQQFLKTEWP